MGRSGNPRESRTRNGEKRESPRIESSEWGEAGIPRESRTRNGEKRESRENRELGMGRSGNLENISGLENGLLSTNVILATLWDLSTLRRLWTYWALRGLLRIVVD